LKTPEFVVRERMVGGMPACAKGAFVNVGSRRESSAFGEASQSRASRARVRDLMRVLWVAIALGGCGSAVVVEGPGPTVEAYARAVQAQDAEAVHALLDADSRETVDSEEVARLLEENQTELRERAEVAQRQLEGIESRATVRLPSGELAVLTLEDGEWKLLGGVLDAPALQTPEDAVRAMRHALQRQSMSGVLRVLARAPRAQLDAEVERFLDDTEDELDYDVEIEANEALVRASNGRVIRLVREAGEWRIAEVE